MRSSSLLIRLPPGGMLEEIGPGHDRRNGALASSSASARAGASVLDEGRHFGGLSVVTRMGDLPSNSRFSNDFLSPGVPKVVAPRPVYAVGP